MYAVIETGGKQYRVAAGDIIQIEKLEGEIGSPVKFEKILFASKQDGENAKIWLGKPYLNGAHVETEIVGQGRGDKIIIVKMKRRKQYRRTQGHRQFYTQLLITGVDNGAGEKTTLSATDKEARMNKFQSHLKPRGEAFHAPLLGSRMHRIQIGRGGEAHTAETHAEGAEKTKKHATAHAGAKKHATPHRKTTPKKKTATKGTAKKKTTSKKKS